MTKDEMTMNRTVSTKLPSYYDETSSYDLLSCPFCGGKPEYKYIGNDYTKKRFIEIKCSDCRATKRNGAIRHGFSWLESVAVKDWNQTPRQS